MDYTFSVTRNRQSATQGTATVHLNGKEIVTFEDPIELVEDGQKYYGLKYGSWASTKPDGDFVHGALFHPHEDSYQYSDKVKEILKEESVEKSELDSSQVPKTIPKPEINDTVWFQDGSNRLMQGKVLDIDNGNYFVMGAQKSMWIELGDLEKGSELHRQKETQVLNQMNSMEMG